MKNRIKTHLPNFLTLLRVLLVPVFIIAVIMPSFYWRLFALLLFIMASVTDFIDGKLARRWQVTSEFGKFMDPLADKMLVVSSLLALVYLEDQIELWMVLVIIGRDMLITFMRWFAIRRGQSLKTSRLGKIKTTFQMLSIMIILLIIAVRTHPESDFIRDQFTAAKKQNIATQSFVWEYVTSKEWQKMLAVSPYILMLLTTIFTIISGLRYIYTNYRLFLPQKELE